MGNAFRKIQLLLFFSLLALGNPAHSFADEGTSCPNKFFSLTQASLNKVGDIWSGAGRNWKVYRGSATSKLDAESFAIFEKVRTDPAFVLSAEEESHLNKLGLEPLLAKYRKTSAAVKNLNHLFALQARSQPIGRVYSSTWLQTLKDFGRNLPRSILDNVNLVLLPGMPAGPNEIAKRIYSSALRDMNFELSPMKEKFLKMFNLLDDFHRFEAEAKEYQKGFLNLTRVREGTNYTRWGVILGAEAGAALAPLYLSERVSSEEERVERASKLKGGIQLLFSEDPDYPVILKSPNQAVVINMLGAKFYRREIPGANNPPKEKDDLALLEKHLAEKKVNYNQVFFRANNEELNKVMTKAKEFVSVNRTQPDGAKVFANKMHIDAPLGEAYKILQSELGLPQAPVFKRSEPLMTAYLSAQKSLGDPATRRVREVLRVRLKEDSLSEAQEVLENMKSTYGTAMLYLGAGAGLVTSGALAVDALPNTIIEKTVSLDKKPETAKAEEKKTESMIKDYLTEKKPASEAPAVSPNK